MQKTLSITTAFILLTLILTQGAGAQGFAVSVTLPPAESVAYTTLGLPEGATKRFGKGTVRNIAYSPDGRLLAVASSIGVWLYDTVSREDGRAADRAYG